MAAGLVYRNSWLYELVMIALYGRHYAARYRAVSDCVPDDSSVLDLCCGPGILFDRYLKHKNVDYNGLDINKGFIDRIQKHGGKAQTWDLRSETPLPTADVVIMQASLYQFLPDPGPALVLGRMLRAARRRVVIAEPIRNLADSSIPLLAALARRQTNPGHGDQAERFTEQSLDAFFQTLGPPPSRSFLIPGGREKVYVLDVEGKGDEPRSG